MNAETTTSRTTLAPPAPLPTMPARRRERLADRLARTLIVWVGGVWVASLIGVVWYVDREINRNFDSEMMESAHRMLDIAVYDYDQALATGASAAAVLPLLGREPLIDDDPVVFHLVNGEKGLLMRSRQSPQTRFEVPPKPGFAETGPWRVYTVAHPSRKLFLHLADPLDERRLHRNRTLLGLAVPLAAILPLLMFLLRRLARRELCVLQRLETQIAARGSADLSPIEIEDMPAEPRSVGEHVNRLLDRLAHALDSERALAANAAHELRTPLAAVRLRLQTAIDGGINRTDVEAALLSLAKLSHRTEKLLQLSRAESGAALARSDVDLVRLAAMVVDEFWGSETVTHRIDLEIDDAGIRAARGDADTIAIALRNLIENALRYAPGSTVEVAVIAPATLVVRDTGPGVPPSLLQALRARHVRRAADSAGYGLGLSIIGTIVETHEATLELFSPRSDGRAGFEARVVLRPA